MYVGEQDHNCAARSFDFRLTRNEKVAEGGRSDYINLVDKSLITQQNSEPIKIGVDTRRNDPDVPLPQDEADDSSLRQRVLSVFDVAFVLGKRNIWIIPSRVNSNFDWL